MTRTSIVVPSRGGASRLPVLFESLRRQDDADFEVIVVVDGDIDRSEQVAGAVTDLPVRAIVFPENRGRSAALNAGFEAARGDVLIRCDDDLELEPDFVSHHVALHRDTEQGVVTLCREVYAEPTPYARVFGIPADDRIRAMALSTAPDQRWRWWSGCVSASRAVHERVGPYDLGYRTYGWEDVDWGYRLHRLGVPIVIPADFDTAHHGPVTNVRERAQRAFHSGAARLRFEQRHGSQALSAPLDPTAAGRNAWTSLVEACSTLVTERSVQLAASALDHSIDRLPFRASEKAVSLLVESAGTAGRRFPRRIRSTL